jgi:hypothetical protein
MADSVVACMLRSPAGDAWFRKKYQRHGLKTKVILLVNARIQQI